MILSDKLVLLLLFLSCLTTPCLSNELSPPLITLNETSGATVTASSTCGDPPSFFQPPNSNTSALLSCNNSDSSQSYPATNLLDPTPSRWQSENTVSPVSATVSLPDNQTFEVYLLFIMFYSKLPNALVIEVSRDGGGTYTPWQYYVSPTDDESDACQAAFGGDVITRFMPYDDDITNPRAFCSLYPQLSVEGGLSQLIWGPLFMRDVINNARLDFIRVSHVRITMSGFSSELTGAEQQYFSLAEVRILGRCVCHGHASACDTSSSPYQCSCEHNTAGTRCETCQHLYNQQPWMQSLSGEDTSSCEACNCMEHATSCVYNELAEGQSLDAAGNLSGGGVCQNCQHNTMGYNCEECIVNTYRDPTLTPTHNDTCKLCDCYLPGTVNNEMDCVMNEKVAISPAVPGDCFCRVGVGGSKCDQCLPDYFNTSSSVDSLSCSECGCSIVGSVSGSVCDDQTGHCVCRDNIGDGTCEECLDGYHMFSPQGCVSCSCDVGGSLSSVCNKSSGYCTCIPGIQNQQCSEVTSGFFIPSPHSIHTQAEYGVDANSSSLPRGANQTEFPDFLGQGYVIVGEDNETFLISINVPIATTYRLVLRYLSETIGFISFRFIYVDATILDIQGVFPLSSINSPDYTGANVIGSNTPLEVDITTPGEYILYASRSRPERVLVDLLTLIPTLFYYPDAVLGNNTQDISDNCDFTSNSLPTDLCIQATFSLSAYLVDSATACDCSPVLSTSTVCQAIGGQCSCRPGVTGRTCDRCIFGYYNNGTGCIPCGCPDGAICDDTTGQCPCSTGVTGRQCDECDVMFYQDSTAVNLVCSRCDCSSPGSLSNTCNKTDGQCECRENVASRTCDRCSPDHWGLDVTGCQPCGCDLSGSEDTQCDLTNGQCTCKQLTEGVTCDQCSPGSFLLSPHTPTGCTQCYCSNLTSDCNGITGSYLDSPLSLSSSEWSVVSLSESGDIISENITVISNAGTISVSVSSSLSPLFLSYPLSELQVTLLLSYGGFIRISLSSSITDSAPRLILHSPPHIVEYANFPPRAADSLSQYLVPLFEFAWTTLSGSYLSRGDFIDLLVSDPLLLIRIGEGTNYSAILSDVTLDRASSLTDDTLDLPVERCQCPVEYSGHSCQKCATGFFRDTTGACTNCECNGHSTDCDSDTGACISCMDNTEGHSCQNCRDTYYGDATQGTNQDCQLCPCSLYTATSLSCSSDPQGQPVCSCRDGHIGNLCDRCDGLNNYHGDPVTFPNTTCSQCTCSGNIDFSVPNSCNTTTGQCTRCINNSTGSNCQLCLPGYFGDATVQSCQPCQCNNTGSTSLFCNITSGQCSCVANVTNRQCDTCVANFYNFNSLGCNPCLCDLTGSIHSQCSDTTGQCPCKVGVSGMGCQNCAPGFYNFSDTGCTTCQCGIGATNTSCDQTEGYCYCQPGVGGDKCDQCLPFHENIMSSGCALCDACTEQLGRTVMYIQDNDLVQLLDKLSILDVLSSEGETLLSSHQLLFQSVSKEVRDYMSDVEQYRDRIRDINAGGLNDSALATAQFLSEITEELDMQSPIVDNEFSRIRDIALDVEMVLAFMDQMQMEIITLVQSLNDQLEISNSALQSAEGLLGDARFNYSANITQAMETLLMAEIGFNRANLTSMQLLYQQGQVYNLTSIANYLKSYLQALELSLDNLKSRNDENAVLINSTTNFLKQADTSVNIFEYVLENILTQITQTQTLIDKSVETTVMTFHYYSIAVKTLNGSSTQSYNLEEGDEIISRSISDLITLHSNLSKLLLQTETHLNELVANTTRIETYYNTTHPVALQALEVITDYRKVIKLINESCFTAEQAARAAAAAVQDSNELLELGVLQQVKIESIIAGKLLNTSIELEKKVTAFILVEYIALKISINGSRILNEDIERVMNRARTDLDSILARVSFFSSQVNLILSNLPPLKSCIYSQLPAPLPIENIRTNISTLITRVATCADRIERYNEQGNSANVLLNNTANALMERVHSITNSASISLTNMNNLDKIGSIMDNIVTIRNRTFAAIAKLKIALELRTNSSLAYHPLTANVPLHYTQMSVSFRSSVTDGTLLYIRSNSGHSVSLYLEDRVLNFFVDLGTESANVSIGEVALNSWYQVLATRDTKQLTMSLSSQQIDNIQTRKAHGLIDTSLSLLFSPSDVIYLGHSPRQTDSSDVVDFEGCVQDLVFNHMPIPLFDPIDRGEVLISCGMRPVTRSYTNGTWFLGGGYITLELTEVLLHTPGTSLSISFRTLTDGILLQSTNTDLNTQLTLHVSERRVRLDVLDRGEVVSLHSTHYVTDNDRYVVTLHRDEIAINVQVNQHSIVTLNLTNGDLTLGSSLSIGGTSESAVSETLSGDVMELLVNGMHVDLQESSDTSRTAPVSPSDVTAGTYHAGSGYAEFPLHNSTLSLQSISFSFSTTSLTGLLLLLFTDDLISRSPIHLTMEHGTLTLSYIYVNSFTRKQAVVTLGEELNDGNFHSVTIDFSTNVVNLTVDKLSRTVYDCDEFEGVYVCERGIQVSTPLYVGGVPDSERLSIAIVTSYKGCVRDIKLNDVSYNYENADILSGIYLYGCVPATESPTPTSTVISSYSMSSLSSLVTMTSSVFSTLTSMFTQSLSSTVSPQLSLTTHVSSPSITMTPTTMLTSTVTPPTSIRIIQGSTVDVFPTTSVVSSSIPPSSSIIRDTTVDVFDTTVDVFSTTSVMSSSIPPSSSIMRNTTIDVFSTTSVISSSILSSTTIPTSSFSISPVVSSTVTPIKPRPGGYRFDSLNNSYVLLDIPPTELATDTVFRIELTSVSYHGVIFFVNGLNNFDFIELAFLEGRIQFSFSLGSIPTRVITADRYNDGVKYRVEATRLGPIGLLSVLEVVGMGVYTPREYVRTSIHDMAFERFDLSNNFYFGGRPGQQVSPDMCVTSLAINGQERVLSSGILYRVNTCDVQVSRAATFFGSGSYLQQYSSYHVGRNFTAQLEFRTYNSTGLLFYVANPVANDYVVVELRSGSVVYSVDNGGVGNVNKIVYTPSSPFYLSNGAWHSVSLTKRDNYITLTVDGVFMESSVEDQLMSVDTKNYPLLIGGIKPGITTVLDVTTQSFNGCVRDLFLNDGYIPLRSLLSYKVDVVGCSL